jgi:hypothetical protein
MNNEQNINDSHWWVERSQYSVMTSPVSL